jgi:hypothetical protein
VESCSAVGKTDDLSYSNPKEQTMNTDGSLPTEATDPEGAVRCCSSVQFTGYYLLFLISHNHFGLAIKHRFSSL